MWDTGVVIAVMEGVLPPAALAEFPGVLGSVSVGELALGVALAGDPAVQLARRMRLDLIRRTFTTFPFDDTAAEHYGGLTRIVHEAGRNPRPRRLDLQIAATALAHGLPLVTRNASDFRDITGVLRVVVV